MNLHFSGFVDAVMKMAFHIAADNHDTERKARIKRLAHMFAQRPEDRQEMIDIQFRTVLAEQRRSR